MPHWTKPNTFVTEGETTKIYVRVKDGTLIDGGIIDTEDLPKIKDFVWHLNAQGYLVTTKPMFLHLHRYLLGLETLRLGDHINRDKKDNRKENLRIVSKTENNLNRGVQKNNGSGFTGVRWIEDCHKWMAKIRANGKEYRLGYFKTKEEAIEARKKGEEKYWRVLAERIE